MNLLKTFVATLGVAAVDKKLDTDHIFSIKINALNGEGINLQDYKGKYILFVNVASKCGFTGQYKALQELHEKFKNKLVVIGVPCNQFGGQEPGDAETISQFCEVNYGVSFLITEKINVKGTQQHELYKWLTKKVNNGVANSSVKWNFQKYLIDTQGNLLDYYYSSTSPLSSKIINHLK